MGETTGIQWCDHSFNPWIGCAHVSPGCVSCYAERDAKRYGLAEWGAKAERHVTSDAYWRQPLAWNRRAAQEGRRHRVFCASMADVFEPLPALAKPRERLWDLMAETPWLDWQLLTKRPEEVAGMVPWGEDWPANVWLGTSVENQEWADKRIPILLSLPAKVRFLSCEPLVGEVDLEMCDWTPPSLEGFSGTHNPLTGEWWPAVGDPDEEYRNRLTEQPQVNWVIVGGESGPHARRMDLAWAQRLVDQCDCAEVPCFVKQLGAAYRQPKDSHGADMAYWPESLRVRQMPESVGTAPGQAVLL